MEKFFDILKSVSLFHGIDPADYPRMLACLNASPRHFLAGEWILLAGAPADRVGVLLEGRAQVVREELEADEPSVIIARRPCVLLKYVKHAPPFVIDDEKCKKCKACMRIGCPAISITDGRVVIDDTLCVGCDLCTKLCSFGAIKSSEVHV